MAAAAALAPNQGRAQPASVTDIGRTAGPFLALSGDGGTLAGTDPSSVAFIWTAPSGRSLIGVPSGATTSSAFAISADGSVVAGDDTTASGTRAFRWTRAGGFADLGALNPAAPFGATLANGISGDGSTIVGSSTSTTTAASGAPNLASHPFIWTAATGLIDLTPGSTENGTATAISRNGLVVVGTESPTGLHPSALPIATAFRWTAAGGMTSLNGLTAASATSYAQPASVNADGSAIAGNATAASGSQHAVLWNAAGTPQDLGTLGGASSSALGVSGDGSVVVGTAQTGSGAQRAFRWTSAGMLDLNQALMRSGVSLGGIALQSATSVSVNGQFIAATGTEPGDSAIHGFLVRYALGATGLTTQADLVASIDQIGRAKSRLLAQQFGLASILAGEYLPVASGSEADGFAAIGSVSGGAGGRIGLSEGLSVRVGVAGIAQRYDGVAQNGAALTALSLRYVSAQFGIIRPLVEAGGWFAPDLPLTFARSYQNGTGPALGQGTSHGGMNYVYARAGGIVALSDADDLVLTGEIGREYLATSAWTEAASAQNPFNATLEDADATLVLGKLRAQWTHRFGARLDATLLVAGVRALATFGTFDAAVAGLGPVTARLPGDALWAEYGARIGWRFDLATVEVFAGGVSGGSATAGTGVHGGVGVRVPF